METKDPILVVLDIFNSFFGEDNVDLQGRTILVHFPSVTVTNENNRSVNITHLWAKILLEYNGTLVGSFTLMRSEYTEEQFASGYAHSHINSVNTSNFNSWKNPCLGSGPINYTISALNREFSEDMWNLFCLELSKYVTVESLIGVPYIRLESIGNRVGKAVELQECRELEINNPASWIEIINKFIPYVIHKKPFRFNYNNGSFSIAMSPVDTVVTLSNLFIEWYNNLDPSIQPSKELLFENAILKEATFYNFKLCYAQANSIPNFRDIIGTDLFKFKDKYIKLNIIKSNPAENSNPILLSSEVASIIVDKILRIINYRYGKDSTENTSSIRGAIKFL